MTSYLKQVKDVIYKSDLIIEVVDARFPMDSRNFELERLIQKLGKKYMIIINKADLVPELFAKKAARELSREVTAVYLSSPDRHGTRTVFDAINKLRQGKNVTIGVIGYPNVGKSTVINILKGRHSAPTANKPGHTKGIQLLRIAPNVMLVDTPGVLPLRGKRGAVLRGSVPFNQIDDIEIAVIEMIRELINRGAGKFIEEKYGIPLDDLNEYLEKFAMKYNLLRKGGVADTERAARRIYQDWLKGRLKVYWM